MLKKTIAFEDFDGNKVTEEFFFNLTKTELVEMEVSEKHGLAETLQEIVKSGDGEQIIANFKKIILLAYGVKSEDGRRFIKNDTLREEFSQTAAFSELFIELATNAEAASAFINGVVPASMAEEIKKTEVETPSGPKTIQEMTREELVAAMQAKNISQ